MAKLILAQDDSPTFDAEELLKVVDVRLAMSDNGALQAPYSTPPLNVKPKKPNKLPRIAPPSISPSPTTMTTTAAAVAATSSAKEPSPPPSILLPDDRCMKAAMAASAARDRRKVTMAATPSDGGLRHSGRSQGTLTAVAFPREDSPTELVGSPDVLALVRLLETPSEPSSAVPSTSSGGPNGSKISLRQRRGVQLCIDVELAERRARQRRAPSLPFESYETDVSTQSITTKESEMLEAGPAPRLVRGQEGKTLQKAVTPGIVVLSPLSDPTKRNGKLVLSPCSYEEKRPDSAEIEEQVEVLQAGSLDWRRSTAGLKDPPPRERQPRRLRSLGSAISLRSCFGLGPPTANEVDIQSGAAQNHVQEKRMAPSQKATRKAPQRKTTMEDEASRARMLSECPTSKHTTTKKGRVTSSRDLDSKPPRGLRRITSLEYLKGYLDSSRA